MECRSIYGQEVRVKEKIKILKTLAAVIIFFCSASAWAGPVTEQVEKNVDRALEVLKDKSFKSPELQEKRRAILRNLADELFNWEELSRRSLGIYWRDLTPEQKKAFIPLFTDLLERTYMNRIESYSGEKIIYGKESVEDQYALLETKVVTPQNVEYPVNYWLIEKQGKWGIYDVSVEGVSLVKNYRTQFYEILARSSVQELLKKLREKQAAFK